MFLPSNITLKFGDSGDFVTELQHRLAAVHCFGSDAVNGFFDGTTVNGVSTFQSMNGLRADGIAGPETLRRLNGVISGDTSSTNNHQDEQDRLAREEAARQIAQQEAFARQQLQEQERLANEQLAAEQATQQHQSQHAQTPQQPEIRHAQEAAYAPPQQHQVVQETAHLQMQQQMQQQVPQPMAQAPQYTAHQPAAPAMQMQAEPQYQHQQIQPQMAQAPQYVAQQMAVPAPQPQTQQQQQAPHLQHQQVQAQTHAAPAKHAPVQANAPQQAAPLNPAAAYAAPVQHQAVAAAPHAVEARTAEPAATASKGLVGRAMQYANDMVQKLSNYFESKLPTHVIDEVKDIGMTMAKSGVREAAIPTGPQQQRGPDTPARAPQQQAVPHRA